MIAIIFSIIFAIGIGWLFGQYVHEDSVGEDLVLAIGGAVVVGLVSFIFFLGISCSFIIPATGGLGPNYSRGEYVGFITNTRITGIVWDTREIEMQVGAGELASLQKVTYLSVPDEFLWEKVKESRGKKVTVSYNMWLIQPFYRGNSGRDITNIMVHRYEIGKTSE